MPRPMLREEDFLEAFLLELVLRDKTCIYIRGPGADEERRRMRALYDFMKEKFAAVEHGTDQDKVWFFAQMRNACAPDPFGTFNTFRMLLCNRMWWLIAREQRDQRRFEQYRISVDKSMAARLLKNVDEDMRQLAIEAVDAYMSIPAFS